MFTFQKNSSLVFQNITVLTFINKHLPSKAWRYTSLSLYHCLVFLHSYLLLIHLYSDIPTVKLRYLQVTGTLKNVRLKLRIHFSWLARLCKVYIQLYMYVLYFCILGRTQHAYKCILYICTCSSAIFILVFCIYMVCI